MCEGQNPTYAGPKVEGAEYFDGKVWIHLANDLNAVSCREVGLLQSMLCLALGLFLFVLIWGRNGCLHDSDGR